VFADNSFSRHYALPIINLKFLKGWKVKGFAGLMEVY